ncbi:AglZ/HisF2 family acetamidino modification protein [Bacteroidota bacterium]
MFRPRIIPCLLLKDLGLVKSVRFKKYKYVGDPINAVKIFNEKIADELIFLDITATLEKRNVDIDLVRKIGEECNMPFSVGGGIRDIKTVREILNAGAEKVIINSYAVENPDFIRDISDKFGVSTIVVSIDAKKSLLGKYRIYTHNGKKFSAIHPVEHAMNMEKAGAGEIVINSIDKDGTLSGYDIELTRMVADSVNVPVIALGGAGDYNDFNIVVKEGGASAAAAGSIFVFHGPMKGVLISFPSNEKLVELFSS